MQRKKSPQRDTGQRRHQDRTTGSKATQGRAHPEDGQLVIGRIPVLEALRAGKRRPIRLLIQHSAHGLEEIYNAAGNTPVQSCSREELDHRVAGQLHQGVLLEAAPLPLISLADCLETITHPEAFVLILDGVEDPRNFGGIVRSAAALGAEAVIFGRDRSAPLSAAALKAAAGAMEYMNLVQVTNLSRSMETLKENGFWVVGLDADAPQTIWEANLDGRLALVVGSEGKGIRRLVSENCDFLVRIPLTGPVTSLNASVSAALAMTECLRRRVGNETGNEKKTGNDMPQE